MVVLNMDRIYTYNDYLRENYTLIQIFNINNQLIRILENKTINETKYNIKELSQIMNVSIDQLNEIDLELFQLVAYRIIKDNLE